jgi:NADH pyrophosphatase NudC (nudix superfamily)
MAENTTTARFCGQCGTPLPWPCPACGFENEPATKFCGGCGKPMEEAAAPTAPTAIEFLLEMYRRETAEAKARQVEAAQ